MGTALVRFVPRIGDIIQLREDHPRAVEDAKWRQRPYTWRVTGYMKAHVRKPSKLTGFEAIIADILEESCREFDTGKGKTRLAWCDETQAEYVCGSGVAGCCYPIEDVVVVGRVKWKQSMIDEAAIRSRRNWGEVLF
ncbi:hypothetical protein KEU06_08980 [Pseudaminobacter sp. 19-2017]|uniref:Uncharacterized protein n=1 Tax=Pseudaminobacter soli (ex Zhang et al. 2022) TaxID=2831468 RepID=A0A942E0H6_9HYPH|nr:hypothetical protein [Pseudaminobacter soli]MBS3648761.1 hypothetical protein [Pseudaminobacter soli]